MDRDLRQTPRFREIETLYRSILEPGFGRMTRIGDPRPSPDGTWVAFRGERLDALEGHHLGRIGLVRADGSEFRQATDGPNDDTGPRWAPDGSALTFLSDRNAKGQHQLFRLDADGPGEAQPLGAPLPGVVEWHAWSPAGDRILVGMAGNAAEQADALGSGTLGAERDLPGWIPEVESFDDADAERRSLWVLSADGSERRRISREDRNVWEAAWCGDGAAVAVVSDGAGEDAWYRASVSMFDLASGEERTLATSDVQLGWATGSPDGARVAVVEALCSDRVVVAGDLVLIDSGTGAASRIDLAGADATWPVWRDADRLLVFALRGVNATVFDVDVETGAATEVWTTTEGLGDWYPAGQPLGDGFVTTISSHARPPALIAVEGGAERVVADTRHPGHDVVLGSIGSLELLRWTAPDGLEIEGFLTVPTGDPPFPLILDVHGGPVGAVTDHWQGPFDATLLARGFAILAPNPRGSGGRGRDFAERVVGDMGGQDVGDVLAGVDAVVAAGVADPDRLVLMGGSYGGFMAAWIPTLDQRFKASVSISPVTDWWSERFDSSLGSWVGDFLGGQPQEMPQEYTGRSPVLHVASVTTPVLLTAGRNDRATPVGQAVEFYRALRERGVPTEVVKYPQEGHGVGEFPAVLDLVTRTVTWFERFLPEGDASR